MDTGDPTAVAGGLRPHPSPSGQIQEVAKSKLLAEARRFFSEGIELLNRGEACGAVERFEQALAVVPDFADAHVGLGIAFAVDSRIYRAIDHLEKAAELAPGNFYAHFKLGQMYFKLWVPERGYAAISRALEYATRLEERKVVAQLLREQKQREHGGLKRPWWNKTFHRASLYAMGALAVAILFALAFRLF